MSLLSRFFACTPPSCFNEEGEFVCSICTGGTSEVHKFTKDNYQDKKAQEDLNREFGQTMKFLFSKVPLFKLLPKDQHPVLTAACSPVEFEPGKVIIQQGDAGYEFFVIRDGRAAVTVAKDGRSERIATLKAGDYFGENALLRDEPRSATITAETHVEALQISRSKFEELGLHKKLRFANRKAVGGGQAKVIQTQAPSSKTPEEKNLMARALRSNDNLTMLTLDDTRVQQIIDVAWKQEVSKGQTLTVEGELDADYFYIVQAGKFEVFSKAQQVEGEELKVLNAILPGSSFGELALMYLVPRNATVQAAEASVVWVIDRSNFKAILMKATAKKVRDYVKLLKSVEILNVLLNEELEALAKALVEVTFEKGDHIIKEGDRGSSFYVLVEGEVAFSKDGNETETVTASLAANTTKIFGERALLNDAPRAMTVTVKTQKAQALALDREAFNMLLAPLEDIIKASNGAASRGSSLGTDSRKPQMRASMQSQDILASGKVPRSELRKVGLLGTGGFATVDLYEHQASGQTFAMKALNKAYLEKTGMQDSVINEKNILMMTNSDFIVKLYACYNGKASLYFLLEPAMGGELYATYSKLGLHGSVRHAMYYTAGVVFAFEHLHDRFVIYRDLKPENLLLTSTGHIKLTDFGLAAFVVGKTYTTCGTPDYFAPELIASAGHTKAVDWWTLGILIYELITGAPPFEDSDAMKTYARVMQGIDKVKFHMDARGPVGDLVKLMCRSNPSERLPVRPGGLQSLKQHAWYKGQGFDWEAMFALTLPPPFVPEVASKTDLSNFNADELESNMNARLTTAEEMQDLDVDANHRKGKWDADFAT